MPNSPKISHKLFNYSRNSFYTHAQVHKNPSNLVATFGKHEANTKKGMKQTLKLL